MKNPFVTKGYAGPEYFCDRVEETKNIVDLLTNDNNLALISPRRLGKTDLIRHCFNQYAINNNYYSFLIDIYSTKSLNDFVYELGKGIVEELKPRGRKVWEQFVNTLKSIHSQISFDIHGYPVWGLGLSQIPHPEITLDEIFYYLNHADKPCIVAIDEFQQITFYKDSRNVEATLRTYIQRSINATFIFSGSKRHLMGEIFTSPSRPFYQSVITIGLSPLKEEVYVDFAVSQFEKHGKHIESDVVRNVYEKFNGVTLCMQRVMNIMYLRTAKGETCKADDIAESIDYLLDLLSENYDTQFGQIPEKQQKVLIAIAAEHKVKDITSGSFVRKYNMLSASSVMSAARALLDKDIITCDIHTYSIYDNFFELWIRREKI